MFSAAQYAAWALVLISSGILAAHIGRRPQGLIRILRWYLFAQISYAAILLPISFSGHDTTFYVAYIGASIVDYAIQFWLFWRIAQHLKGKFDSFGRIRSWALAALILTTLAASRSLLMAPFDGWPALWTRIDQVLYVGRTVALVGVGLYGWVLASCWPRRVLFIWLGFAIYGAADFASSRLDILTSYTHHHLLQYIPAFGFLIATSLWWRVKGFSPSVLSNSHSTVQLHETISFNSGPLSHLSSPSDLLPHQQPPELPEALPSLRQL